MCRCGCWILSDPDKNRLTVTNQWTYQSGTVEKRFDVVFLVNGLPLVIGEAKTPTRSAVTWFDGAYQINEIYEKEMPAMFVPNVFSFATEGSCLRYGSIRMPIDLWGPWRDDDNQDEGELRHVRATVDSLMRPGVVLDILQNFTLFATDKKHRRIKVICRYQQYETTNKIVARVVAGYPKKGLIWHFQGSGKCLLMVFAAQKLRHASAAWAIPPCSSWWTASTSIRRSPPPSTPPMFRTWSAWATARNCSG